MQFPDIQRDFINTFLNINAYVLLIYIKGSFYHKGLLLKFK